MWTPFDASIELLYNPSPPPPPPPPSLFIFQGKYLPSFTQAAVLFYDVRYCLEEWKL
jgi:hypothetical protein